MKKINLILVITILTVISLNAQNFGVKAGLNLANLSGDEYLEEFDMRTSFHIGGVYEVEISDNFSFQPELMYSAQGAQMSEGSAKVVVKLDYINIPLMAKFYAADGFSIEAGPQVGFLIVAETKYEAEGESETDDIKDDSNTIDFGLNFGLGYKLESGLNFGARYNLGLTTIVKEEEDYDETVKNGVIQISVGYFF